MYNNQVIVDLDTLETEIMQEKNIDVCVKRT